MDVTSTSTACPRCGSQVSAEDRYCPRCGEQLLAAPVTPPAQSPAAPAPEEYPPAPATPPAPAAPPAQAEPATVAAGRAPRQRSTTVIWVLLALIALLLIVWALLAWLPFGEEETELQRESPAVEVVRENPTEPAATQVVIEEIDGAAGEEVPIAELPESALRRPPAAEGEAAPPVAGFSTSPPPEGSVTESEAVATLTSWVTRNDRYGVEPGCIRPRSEGYSNRGYTIVLTADGCTGRSGTLGRWRVDTATGRLYEQKPDGRYLDP